MNRIKLKSTFTEMLPSDPNEGNFPRQVMNVCFSYVKPKGMASPIMVIYSKEVADDLNLEKEYCESPDFTAIMTGNKLAEGSKPYAMCYGGHQFGHWAGQLGDGRAINLGEITTLDSHLNLQLKGAGPTPYSRTADGFAVLRSSVREFLCSEAMFHLGVPTTRALSLTLTGEEVLRDIMYNGNAAFEKGAVVCRVAPSFIRFGNFEIFSSRNDTDTLRKLTDYTIHQYYPHLSNNSNKYIQLFSEVADRTCDMIVHWQRTGFVHGVMNTDNMSILGLTIDYGPYGWIDNYDPNWTPNTTDLPGKRYRFANQPVIAQWNLLKLANALYPLINDEEVLKNIVQDFRLHYTERYLKMMKSKLGLFESDGDDEHLISELEKMLQMSEIDMTIFFRNLVSINTSTNEKECLEVIKPAIYDDSITEDAKHIVITWCVKYQQRLKAERITQSERKRKMNSVNPKYVLRNYMAQMAIDNAEKGSFDLIYIFYDMLKRPYNEQPEYEKWFAKRPDWAREKVGCSMLSCSS